MRVQVLKHVPFEGIGSIEHWLARREAQVEITRFWESPRLPRLSKTDFVIIMGGPMSANDEHPHPWLRAEKQFICSVIEQGIPLLGICLGAQLIASALGSPVYLAPNSEIGWFPVRAVQPEGKALPFPPEIEVFHWHGETFDLPPRAIHLAGSEACPNQAFQVGKKVIGLQFHLEATPETVEKLVQNCGDELVEGPYIQDAETIRSALGATYSRANRLMEQILDSLS